MPDRRMLAEIFFSLPKGYIISIKIILSTKGIYCSMSLAVLKMNSSDSPRLTYIITVKNTKGSG